MGNLGPLVSVVVPSKNRNELVSKTIDSILMQTYKNIEIIIVDDSSDIPLQPMIENKFGKNVFCVRNKHSLGAPASRNIGFSYCRGEFVAFLDDDDLWLPEKIEKQINEFSNLSSKFGVVYCGYDYLVNENIVKKNNTYHQSFNVFIPALGRCPIGSPTPLIRRSFFDFVGGFDERLCACQDWDLWIRLSRVCLFFPVKESLALYRLHGNQISTDILKKIRSREAMLYKHKNTLDIYPKILSKHFEKLGSLCVLAGKYDKSKMYFWCSVKIYKLNIISWIHIFLKIFSCTFEKLLTERFGVKKINNIKIYG